VPDSASGAKSEDASASSSEYTFTFASSASPAQAASNTLGLSTESVGTQSLSIALIGPDPRRRDALIRALSSWQSCAVQEFTSYPASLDEVPRLLENPFDVVMIDLDIDPEYALDLIEGICAASATTVMVYSSGIDSELLLRCMRAGAREFLSEPFASAAVTDALVRASVRRPMIRPVEPEVVQRPKSTGRFMVFIGAKGGSGVTTLACNFAVLLARESDKKTLLIDLDLPLGGVAVDLGIVAKYSIAEALQNSERLDASFLSRLVVKHASGLWVLAAPGKFSSFRPSNEEIDKLLEVVQQEYDYVVVDAGCHYDLAGTALFGKYATVYLVTQVGIPELRNANLLVTEYFTSGVPALEIILNRYMPRSLGIDEEHVTRALTREPRWKIPNDYITARRTQNLATPLALEDSSVSHALRRMARVACGLPEVPEKKGDKKKLFTSIFG
jgi:pilus assembly protein CpaE